MIDDQRRLGHLCSVFLLWLCMFSTCMAQNTAFPLRTAQDGRYLEDGKGLPILVIGDSAWSLIGDTSIPDAEFYLETRKRQGFNTVLVSLIEHQFSRNAPANFYDEKPFVGAPFDRPNEAYFDRAEAVIKAAASRNLLVLLCPAYMGARGGPEGWYQDMVAAGPEKLRAYGRYVGQRFAKYPNIVWVQGGDYDPPDRNLVTAVAMGIAETNPSALQTFHGNPDTVTSDFWLDASWLDIDSIYTYHNVATAVLDRYRSGPRRPFFLIESAYEGENNVRERQVRLIAYGAMLSGASGQFFGNNPVWHFSAAGLYDAKGSWQESLNSRGAQSITHLAALFSQLAWWKLVPDQGSLLKSDGGAFAARDRDGAFALIYLDTPSVAIDLDSLAAGEKNLRWYDPSNGLYIEPIERLGHSGVRNVTVPASANASGFQDWIAVVSARK
ncbi:DUF4038 domain-containing protein [Rhizobium rhizogenes]|uniref:DUF4038 domain-containing protein n=2 Tax=Rhizobium rhizogenes TaxID=359 RepID=A0AA88EWP4_RHIRH|nr:DUF4038 domain-containing protein [Rhizobium rhizogenes]